MKTIYYLLVLIFGFVGTLYSQIPDTLWTQTFGGPDREIAGDIQQTADGGYIITGSTMSFGAGQYDVYLIKTDVSGIEQWSRTFGGSDYDMGRSVQQTSDSGYIITGYTQSFGPGSYDVYLIKTDDTGIELWSKTYGDIYGDEAFSVRQTTDGGYIIAGRTFSYAGGFDVYLIKTDASGTEQWSKTFGGSGHDKCNSVQQTSDGGFILTGSSDSFGPGTYYYDIYLIKTDDTGTEQWSKIIDENSFDLSKSVQQTSDGGYIIAGTTTNYGPTAGDVILIKTDDTGTVQWSQTYGKTEWDAGYDVQQTSDGGYIIVGHTNSYGAGNEDVYLIKTDASGNELWSQAIGGSYEEYGKSIQLTSDGGYIIVGGTESYSAGYSDIWLIKIDADLTDISTKQNQRLISIYPNPAKDFVNIKSEEIIENISVYNHLGQLLINLKVKSLSSQINVSQFKSGIYFVKVNTSVGSFLERIIINN